MDLISPETFGFREYLDKNELRDNIEHNICRYCKHYAGGAYSSACATCKISLVFREIALMTSYEADLTKDDTEDVK